MQRSFVCVAVLFALASLILVVPAQAQVDSFLSTASGVGQGAAPLSAPIELLPGEAASLYLWLSNTAQLQSASYNLEATTPGAVRLVGAEVFQANLLAGGADIGDRWNEPLGNGDASDNAILNMIGVNVNAAGLNPATRSFDELWDADANAGLFAKIDLVAGNGDVATTDLVLSEGSGLIVEGGAQPALTFSGATINVIPEPTALLLAALAVAGVFGLRRRS